MLPRRGRAVGFGMAALGAGAARSCPSIKAVFGTVSRGDYRLSVGQPLGIFMIPHWHHWFTPK